MSSLLMPKATAVWLIENTSLTFEQIADFCNLHVLEVQAIADGDVGQGIIGFDPIQNGQLSREEITKCSNDPNLKLSQLKNVLPYSSDRTKGPKYIPSSQCKPSGACNEIGPLRAIFPLFPSKYGRTDFETFIF